MIAVPFRRTGHQRQSKPMRSHTVRGVLQHGHVELMAIAELLLTSRTAVPPACTEISSQQLRAKRSTLATFQPWCSSRSRPARRVQLFEPGLDGRLTCGEAQRQRLAEGGLRMLDAELESGRRTMSNGLLHALLNE